MKALTWHGKNDIRCDTVPDPKIEHGRDAIIKVTACAICGSDLHLFDGVMPSMEKATSSAMRPWARSSRSARKTRSSRSATASWFRSRSPAANASSARTASSPAASAPTPITRWPRSCGAIPPRACSAIRTCWAATPAARPSISACPMPTSVRSRCRRGSSDEQVLFLSDIFPTGYMAADFCNSRAARRSRSGAAVPSASSRSRAPSCWAPSA